jgi:hypothetical protein
VSENFEVEKEKREISKTEQNRVQRNIEELRQSKEEYFSVSIQCYNNLKSMFSKVGAFLNEQNFIRVDPEGVIRWIESEVEAFDKVLAGRGDFCAYVEGPRSSVST